MNESTTARCTIVFAPAVSRKGRRRSVRVQKGKTPIRPSRPLYATTGRCGCGMEFRSNEAPSKGGTKTVERLHAAHLEQVAGWPEGHMLAGFLRRVEAADPRVREFEMFCECGERFVTSSSMSNHGRRFVEADHAAHVADVLAGQDGEVDDV